MSINDPDLLKDYVQAMVLRLSALDPTYGSNVHQRDFIERCIELQRLEPCLKDHDADNPPEHHYSGKDRCYSQQAVQAVHDWQMAKRAGLK